MLSNAIHIEYPAHFPDALQTTLAAFAQEARIAIAVKLFEMKRLSYGMAAQRAGMYGAVNFPNEFPPLRRANAGFADG